MNNKMSRLLTAPFLTLSLTLFLLMLPKQSSGQNRGGLDVAPQHEKRSCITEADGYASVIDSEDLAQAKAAACADAGRQAVEAAKKYVQSKVKGTDFENAYDLIWPEAERAITILEQKDHGVRDKTLYHVWVKAEVVYDIKPKTGGTCSPAAIGREAPLTVKVWTPKKEYSAGESMEIYVQGNRDFFARIVDITSSREIIQLLPNDYRKISSFEAGKLYNIPDQGDHFGLEVTAPFGEDQIVVYASEVPLGPVRMEPAGQGLRMYKGTRESLGAEARAVSIVPGGLGAEFYEAAWAIATTPGGPSMRGTRRVDPERPIDMTGAAGAKVPLGAPGEAAR